MRDSQSDIQEFVRGSSLIFSATVIKLNASSVTSLAARDNLAVVRSTVRCALTLRWAICAEGR